MQVNAQPTPPGDDPPLLFTIAICSVGIMVVVLGANTVSYLLRHRFERIDRVVQGVEQNRYVSHIQGPAAAVIVAATSGYGVNMLTGDDGVLGYLGLLLALPIPLAMVTWAGIRNLQRTEFEQRWPPQEVPADDPVKVRYTLRRVRAEGARLQRLPAEDLDRLGRVLTTLLDETLPALQSRRDRSMRQWLRDHRRVSVAIIGWGLLTVACATVAIAADLRAGAGRAAVGIAGFVVMTGLAQYGLLTLLRRHSRYRYAALAEEVAESASAVRRRITEQRLGLARSPDLLGGDRR